MGLREAPDTPAIRAWDARGDWIARDDLWRSACWEMAALEAGHAAKRNYCLRMAREILPVEKIPK